MKENILSLIKERVLVLDGAMGTEIIKRGVMPDDCPESLNLTNPDLIEKIHTDYRDAGSDIIQSNTFGGNRVKLSQYNLAGKVESINLRGIELVQRVAAESCYISGSMGPTGKLLAPYGNLAAEDAYQAFAEQAQIFADAGVDLINIETMSDLKEAEIALKAVLEVTELPVICNLTYGSNLKTIMGTTPEEAVRVLEETGADIIGTNCGMGPKSMVEVMEVMAGCTELPLCYQPNAGLPVLNKNQQTEYPMTAAEMLEYIPAVLKTGTRIIGGCCGTSPDYIKLVREIVDEYNARGGRI